MKKDLYWFKFIPDNWLIGDITMEDYEVQGVFINLCAYYWKRGENGVAMGRLRARYREVKVEIWDRLTESDVIKIDDNHNVTIKFLDDQRAEILKEKEFLSNSGKKGAEKRWGGNSKLDIDIDTDIKLEPKKEDKEFKIFWNNYHEITKQPKSDKEAAIKKWKSLNNSEKKLASENIHKYFKSLSDKKYCKKARTYLGDKNFNDEFIKESNGSKYNSLN